MFGIVQFNNCILKNMIKNTGTLKIAQVLTFYHYITNQ